MFEFNAADKVSHLGYTYTWYGVNGVQYTNASHVMRRYFNTMTFYLAP